ncbi:oxygen-dependent protoporphyrinogen oxidase [Prevotella aff. ruminicola Tc2-24]|uniref:Coproporphyrinogen III oxidase n=1 Tax=Prevotella aff. ruminicola Tc2-24 TaxID=81582 RepID=A0A1I0NV64_9BACT|nr:MULTISPECIES: protoporphyrinogen oxidase [Prevotella]SEE51695.1 oxygen-dependent protoporphyrinogen oxidase [Prevotella sp. lc2012]SEW05328.1 oxygen-dependent protoporphyrinogen oxidase [Prevotella aff. ruminicola Tc2-24]
MQNRDIVVIGAGLTGLTTAYHLRKQGRDVLVIEKENRIGGQIRTYSEKGFVFESGPNTGVVSFPEVRELFDDLGDCQLEIARESSKRRLIWKGNRFHALPSGPVEAVTTPLFRLSDKIRILGEPWRKQGDNPDESVGALAQRRLGKSFYEYAIDPFISGVYAGDPMRLTTRYAMPKLYNLEANYGSFIRGAIAKAKEPKTDRDRLATKKVFSAAGGLTQMVEAIAKGLDIITSAQDVKVNPTDDGTWRVTFNGMEEIRCRQVVTTVGAYALPALLPFIPEEQMQPISRLYYAPVIQVCVGIRDTQNHVFPAFGGLVPSKEQKPVLGILFPSECFEGRAPEGGALYSYFIGGTRHADDMQKSDDEIRETVLDLFHSMLKYPADMQPDLIRIFRHERAIPQYWSDSGERFRRIEELQTRYPGLILAGNMRDGIGMANRIHQGAMVAEALR